MRSITIILCLSLVGCSTLKDSTMLGIGIGSLLGTAAGVAAGTPKGNEMKAGAIGAVLGGAIGGVTGAAQFKSQSPKVIKLKPDAQEHEASNPVMSMPKVRRVWVPDRIEGNKFIRGHFIYVIERDASWRMNGGE